MVVGGASVAEDMGEGLLRLGSGSAACAPDGGIDPLAGVAVDRVELLLRRVATVDQAPAVDDEGIAVAPGGRLRLGLVGLGVALVVAVPAVGVRLEQDGAAPV